MIFDGNMDVAAAAAQRWQARAAVREQDRGKNSVEVESKERIQARLDRLAEAATSGWTSTTSSEAVLPTPDVLKTMGLERVVGRSDFQGIAFLELALAVSQFVGRINIRSSATRSAGFGTGFMVSPRLLLTNNHVLPDDAMARFSEVEFDYQNDRFGRPLPVVPFGLRPDVFFMTDGKLDFSLVAVDEQSRSETPLKHYGWSRLIGAQGKILKGEHLNIIQHPRGQFKQFVSHSNELIDVFDDFLHYVTDTEPGSSGSPVYNDQWEVVALHHSGVPKTVDGEPIGKDGKIWDGRDPEDIAWVANEGIRVSSLVRHIEAQQLSRDRAVLRDELLNLEPPNPIEAAQIAEASAARLRDANSVPLSDAGRPGKSDLTSTTRPGVVTITIPLNITVELGTVGVPSAAGQDGRRATSGAQVSPISHTSDTGQQAGQPPEIAAALFELERAPSRVYYDAEADQRAKAAYYRNLRADALEPGELFDTLSTLLEQTHRKPLRYSPATHVYPWVDLRQNHPPTIKSIYSGKGFDPRELIEADVRVEAQRNQVAEAIARESLGLDRERTLDLLEATFPYNCEHVVPQSWFAKREPMRGDLHHLFACEVRCNSFRSNTPYYDFPESEEAVRDECGKSEMQGFEPSAGKGAVARATLYFLLRYAGEVDNSAREYTEDRLRILLDWHRRYPVDEYERHRMPRSRKSRVTGTHS